LGAAFEALDATGIYWLVLPADASALDRDCDLDLLVESDAVSSADAALRSIGFAALPSVGRGRHRCFLGYDDHSRMWVRLDVTDSVDFGRHRELTTATAPELLDRRVRSSDHYRLRVDDAFWHLLLHRLLSGREVPSDDLVRLSQRSRSTGPLADLASRGATSSAEWLELVRRGEWQRVGSLRPAFVRAWRRKHRYAPFLADARDASRRVTRALRSAARPSGISVAIIGPDGAGKTTLADGLRATLPVPSAYVYMGVWREYPWDRWLRYIPGARLAQRMLRLIARSAQARFQRARGRLVLLDRFTYDVLLPSPELDRRGRATAALVRRIGTEPQLVLVLDAPAEVMFARKGEQGIDELERRRLSYLDIARTRADSAVIDATQAIAVVREEAHRAVWARLRRHWTGT